MNPTTQTQGQPMMRRMAALLCVLMVSACATPTPRVQAPPPEPGKAPAAPVAAAPTRAPESTQAQTAPRESVDMSKPQATQRPGQAATPAGAVILNSQQQKAPAPAMPAAPVSPAHATPTAAGPRQIDPNAGNDRIPVVPTAVIAPAPVPADNTFKDYGVNPFVNTTQDRMSTFGLDVDTASYNIAKRYIQQGSLPPYQAVRVEEFVNAFKQGYVAPQDQPFALFVDGATSPFHSDGSYLLRVGVQAYRLPEFARKPAAFTFVLDESGSMADGNRIELARNSVRYLRSKLNPSDTVAIVAFTDGVRVALEPVAASNSAAIERALETVQPKGSTNVEAGLIRGYQLANQHHRAGGINRVVLVSDGVANQGGLKPEAILANVQEYASKGIQFTSVGVGFKGYNDVLMEMLANKSEGGNYMYLNTNDDVEKLFANRIANLQMIAKDAKSQVEFNSQVVQSYRLLGYENRAIADADFRNDAVSGGGIGAGHTATAIYQLRLHPGAQGQLAKVNLRWQDPDSKKVLEINGNVKTDDVMGSEEGRDARFQLAITVAEFGEVLRRSAYRGEGSLRDLASRAQRIAQRLPDDPAVAEFAVLVQRAAQLR